MKNRVISIFAALVFLGFWPNAGHPCSTFLIDDDNGPVYGKNYDWMVDDGLVIVNKRNVSKKAVTTADDNPASWTSKYGSITFNQYGREMPLGGMNEAGLVIELMWLDETEYPAPDSRSALNNLQWIQYQLDSFSTVEEVIATDSSVRIVPAGETKVHYLVADKTGDCASIEFVKGKLACHTRDTMPVKTLTNDTYAKSVDFLKRHEGFGGELPPPAGRASLARFVRAATKVKGYAPTEAESPVGYAFDILADVAQGDYTKWSIVYDTAGSRIYFHTLAGPRLRYVDLSAFDFSCSSPVKVIDINANLSGDIADRFVDYTRELNRDLIGRSFSKGESLKDTPKTVLDALAQYPETTVCTE
jgi:choloylglycine hydrolase